MAYKTNPSTIEDFKSNVQFQLDNIVGYVGADDFESGFIKTKYLIEAFEALNLHIENNLNTLNEK